MRGAVVLPLLLACGDNAALPDALVVDAPDALPAIDAPPPPPGCDWGELADPTNHTEPETTNLVLGGDLVMCGAIAGGHPTGLVDADAFGFATADERTVRVELAGVGLEAFAQVEVAIVNRFGDPIATGPFVGAHAIAAARLPAGDYGVAVRATGGEPAAPVAYTATISTATPCEVAGAPAYTETADGTGTGNDMVDVRFTGDPALRRVLTANPADTPEPTLLTVDATTKLAGTSADVDAADEFRDRDTFAITTGAAIDTLTIRLAWTATTVDLDFLLFPVGTPAELGGATQIATAGPELAAFAVEPSTTYWLWIGSYDTSTNLPVTYEATLCGE